MTASAAAPLPLAVFVSPHGLGHAARAAAVLAALRSRLPALAPVLYTRVAPDFFHDSRIGHFVYRDLACDVGMAQVTALTEDLPATLTALAGLLPFAPETVAALAADVRARGCRAVLCDIAPLGLAVARRAGVPGVLVENFTWDWIYAGYVDDAPALQAHADRLRAAFELADLHIQTEPPCVPRPGALTTPVVSRAPRTAPPALRARLGLSDARPLVLVSGALPVPGPALRAALRRRSDVWFLLTGGAGAAVRRDGNVLDVPADGAWYHPDLVQAADLVVGKLGYSTLAEVYHAGTRFAFVTRPRFRESPVLEAFALARMPAQRVPIGALADGAWLADLDRLLALPRAVRAGPNGAGVIADALLPLLA